MFGNMPTPFLLRLLLLLFLALATTSGGQSYSNITSDTVLTAGGSRQSWPSPSGDFAFCFFPADSNHFLLAIWFNYTSPKSVVWSANRNALLASGATVNLTADGRLSLRDENGTEAWTTPGGMNAVAASELLDCRMNLSIFHSGARVSFQSAISYKVKEFQLEDWIAVVELYGNDEANENRSDKDE
ncbi:hypothetical protein ZIOFF_005222 [Zingiber officinale]|uniref:Bulb-type lectin domain-containing protein n=1 Tax=Zingiber officinale TaxID=94328 RepID=A0A8J5M1E4_ZINOF|nr:hypothetical protein ZIOFF_005222 [Zingiber officinale]